MTILTAKDLEALELLDEADGWQPVGLAGSKETSGHFATIYHVTAARLCLARVAEVKPETDRFGRALYRITPDGRAVLRAMNELRSSTPPKEPA